MKKIISLISVLLITLSLLCVGASADMGPKPSVNVTFPRADGNFYVTLLSKTASTGPYSADHLDDIIDSYSDAAAKSAFRKFAAYEDEDGFVSRLALTIAIEIAVAALFGFFKGKYRKTVLTVNIVTQVLLNVTLNLFDYYCGWLSVIFIYVLCELAIFVIEGVIYGIVFPKCASDGETPVRAWKAWLYSLAANAASFLVGVCIWRIDIALMG